MRLGFLSVVGFCMGQIAVAGEPVRLRVPETVPSTEIVRQIGEDRVEYLVVRCEVPDVDCTMSVYGATDETLCRQLMTLSGHTLERLNVLRSVKELQPYLSGTLKRVHLQVKPVKNTEKSLFEVRINYRMDTGWRIITGGDLGVEIWEFDDKSKLFTRVKEGDYGMVNF